MGCEKPQSGTVQKQSAFPVIADPAIGMGSGYEMNSLSWAKAWRMAAISSIGEKQPASSRVTDCEAETARAR